MQSNCLMLHFYSLLMDAKTPRRLIRTRKPCCHKETARCRSCSFRFKVRRQRSLLRKVSELQTYQCKTEFNAKWPFRVIQGHVFWRSWKGDQGLNSNKYWCWPYLLRFRRCSARNILRITFRFSISLLVTLYNKKYSINSSTINNRWNAVRNSENWKLNVKWPLKVTYSLRSVKGDNGLNNTI